MIDWHIQGLLGIAFFEATAFLILLVLLVLLRRDGGGSYFRPWLWGWACLTVSGIAETILLVRNVPGVGTLRLAGLLFALILFLAGAVQFSSGPTRASWQVLPLAGISAVGLLYLEREGSLLVGHMRWETSVFVSAISLCIGWFLWRAANNLRGHGAKLLAGIFFLTGLHGMDRPLWSVNPIFPLRVAFDHLLAVSLGIAMVVTILEGARARTDELNDKLRRLTLLTTASAQSLSAKGVLDQVLRNLVESLGATHGLVRLLEREGGAAELVIRGAVGFDGAYLAKHARLPVTDSGIQRSLTGGFSFQTIQDVPDAKTRQRMVECGVTQLATFCLPGKEGPLGLISVGSSRPVKFQQDEIAYLRNVANLLGLTLQNVNLFEQVATVQRHWAYTFDSIGDPILVHDHEFRIVRSNQRWGQLLKREGSAIQGRLMSEVLPRKGVSYKNCPYCEGVAGEADELDPWLQGYFLASNSPFNDRSGRQLGTVHVLKDITDRKRAEEKYRALISSVQEGVFISTPEGRFLDFNEAFQQMAGYEAREELLNLDIPSLYVNPSDRERLKKILQEHGSVADFEFEMRRKDGEIRTMIESSIAVRDAAGNVTAFQGFLLDITERKHAEQEIRRRNRELLVLNSIGQTLNESLDLSDSLHRTLRQMAELFSLDAVSVYLLEKSGAILRRVASMGHRSEYARNFPPTPVPPELLQHIQTLRATILSAQGLPLPGIFREMQKKEGIATSYVIVLWSKDRVIGGLVVGSRAQRDFSPADMNLLIAVGAQIANAIERSSMYEETRQAYEDLRRTQEQLLHSEKLAAVGQLISGVAHELNNPLTAILGYSQLLTTCGQAGPQAMEYAEKLYKQAQRTHRIVQNLLSFARQRKPERVAVNLNQVVEEALALRDYDLRISNVRLHLDLAPHLPVTAADPHQLQQVFLNVVNNAVDAILEYAREGDIWVRTDVQGDRLLVEFTDSGPGVKDPSRVFDPFYTTKPVGKGTGLGLSICYGIISEHGGSIRVRNAPPLGATFSIELPWQAPEKGAETSSDARMISSSQGGRILLVDDDESVLEAVGEVLRGREHRVEFARSAEQAQALLSRADFEAIVVDLHLLVNRNGLNLWEWLATTKPSQASRLILMSAGAETASDVETYSRNGCRILHKPFKATEIITVVEDGLRQVPSAPIDS